jgi:hypothetical protein
MRKRFDELKMPLAAALFACFAVFLPACTASREVEVDGTVSTSIEAETQRPVVLEFYDLHSDGWRLSKLAGLTGPGEFHATVLSRGDKIQVVAIEDADFSGECTPGEAWGSASSSIRDDDTTPPIEVAIAPQPTCPAVED